MNVTFDTVNKVPLTEGGEGFIYELNGEIIKIYKPNIHIKSKKHKIEMLMKKSLPKEVVCPKNIVVDRKGNFIGFTMDKVEGDEIKKLTSKKFITSNNITTKDILSMLIKIQNILTQLHKENIYVGDLNDKNILFDSNLNIYFIDCDSWSIENEKCEVAMDLFKDPLLKLNEFNESTDTYAFAILIWKLLTRIHPFGGTMNPDINIIERMKKGLSIINNSNVIIPKTIRTWKNLSPKLINTLQNIFENNCRQLSDELIDMYNNLKICKNDNDYYYGKFDICPICNSNAKIQTKPLSQGVLSGLKLISLLDANIIKTVINENTYLDINNYIVNNHLNKKVQYQYGVKYYFTSDGYLIEDFIDKFIIHTKEDYIIEKKYKSQIVVENNHIYYISKQNSFVEMTVLIYGNNIKNICKCSNNSYFDVNNGIYCIVNYYYGHLIFNVNGQNLEINYNFDIVNYGIHYDNISQQWLVVLENKFGQYMTYIIKGNSLVYYTEQIKYDCPLNCLCISNDILYIPLDGKIRGYSHTKSLFKDFECSIVNNESILIKKKNKFTIINNENIYLLG